MKHLYSVKAVATALILIISTNLFAQSPSTVAPSNQCNVVEDFNDSSGNFRSTSIYTESDYTQFNWESANGYWADRSGISGRNGSIISPVYMNNQASGGVVVGFRFEACAGTEYRIRVINVNCTCVGGTEIIATTANGSMWTALPSESGRICIRINDADIFQGQRLRFEISYRNAGSNCDFIFDDFSLGEVAAAPLPVTFMGIVAKKQSENSVNVLWDVADEIDVKGYQVERSTNGVEFSSIGFVTAHGKSAYSFTDNQAVNGTVFYRVKNVDLDGQFKYSNVVRVSGKRTVNIKMFPMPATTEVTLQHDRTGNNATVTVSTMDGRTVKQMNLATGSYTTKLALNAMAPGMYLVRLDDGNGGVETVKLVKQ
jgi:hypothetical protein